jgi:hypothetical protein
MKKLFIISMVALSLMTISLVSKTPELSTSVEVNQMAKGDEPFDFLISDYLPVGFNPLINVEDLDYSIEEEDEPFDFDIKKYLPTGFNSHINQ